MTAYGFVKKLGLTMERCSDEFDDAGFGLGCQGRSMKYEVLKAERTTTTTTRWLATAGCRHQRLHIGGCTHRQGLPTLTTTSTVVLDTIVSCAKHSKVTLRCDMCKTQPGNTSLRYVMPGTSKSKTTCGCCGCYRRCGCQSW